MATFVKELRRLQRRKEEYMPSDIEEVKKIVKYGLQDFHDRLTAYDQGLQEIRHQIATGGGGVTLLSGTGDTPGARLQESHNKGLLDQLKNVPQVSVPMPGFFPLRDRWSAPDYDVKAVISSGTVGSSTPGILSPTRVSDYVPAAERRFTMRDIIPSSPVSSNAVEFPKENEFTNAASPQPFEGSPKAESSLTFTIEVANVRTFAHWIPATKQVLDDWRELGRVIDSKMLFGLKLLEERQILSGDGTGEHLNGLITQASAFDMSRLVSGDTVIDFLAHACAQLEEADEQATFVVINPRRLWEILRIKDQANNIGNYVAGTPLGPVNVRTLWGKNLVATNSIGEDTFLVGNSEQAEIFDRMQARILISTEHASFFVENKVAILAEERIALAVYRPSAFVTGSFATAS